MRRFAALASLAVLLAACSSTAPSSPATSPSASTSDAPPSPSALAPSGSAEQGAGADLYGMLRSVPVDYQVLDALRATYPASEASSAEGFTHVLAWPSRALSSDWIAFSIGGKAWRYQISTAKAETIGDPGTVLVNDLENSTVAGAQITDPASASPITVELTDGTIATITLPADPTRVNTRVAAISAGKVFIDADTLTTDAAGGGSPKAAPYLYESASKTLTPLADLFGESEFPAGFSYPYLLTSKTVTSGPTPYAAIDLRTKQRVDLTAALSAKFPTDGRATITAIRDTRVIGTLSHNDGSTDHAFVYDLATGAGQSFMAGAAPGHEQDVNAAFAPTDIDGSRIVGLGLVNAAGQVAVTVYDLATKRTTWLTLPADRVITLYPTTGAADAWIRDGRVLAVLYHAEPSGEMVFTPILFDLAKLGG